MRRLAQLFERWMSEEVHPHPPASEASVRQVFSSLGSRATREVIELYGAIGGMDSMDNEHFRLWPLAEVQSENDDHASTKGVLFADYFVACWCYRLLPMDNERSAVFVDYFDHRQPVLVAESLEAFAAARLDRPTDVLHNPPEPSGDA
jgi:hypothetical protein